MRFLLYFDSRSGTISIKMNRGRHKEVSLRDASFQDPLRSGAKYEIHARSFMKNIRMPAQRHTHTNNGCPLEKKYTRLAKRMGALLVCAVYSYGLSKHMKQYYSKSGNQFPRSSALLILIGPPEFQAERDLLQVQTKKTEILDAWHLKHMFYHRAKALDYTRPT